MSRPLVSLIVCGYRHEAVIAEAIRGAIAQTYSPLEIILSDDCSPDGTYAVIERMANDYRGPHALRTNRNATNLGVGGHLNALMELSGGALVVVNAGDDISIPERVARIVEHWLATGRAAHLIHSAAMLIGADGSEKNLLKPEAVMRDNPSPMQLAASGVGTIGATQAWTRELFSRFGPLDPGLQCEDHILPFRAALLGGIGYIDEPLVRYREGGLSSDFYPASGREALYGSWLKWLRWWRDGYRGMIRDLQRHAAEPDPELLRTCRRELARFEAPLEFAPLSYPRRVAAAGRLLRNGELDRRSKALNLFKYLLPWLYAAQFDIKRKLRLLP